MGDEQQKLISRKFRFDSGHRKIFDPTVEKVNELMLATGNNDDDIPEESQRSFFDLLGTQFSAPRIQIHCEFPITETTIKRHVANTTQLNQLFELRFTENFSEEIQTFPQYRKNQFSFNVCPNLYCMPDVTEDGNVLNAHDVLHEKNDDKVESFMHSLATRYFDENDWQHRLHDDFLGQRPDFYFKDIIIEQRRRPKQVWTEQTFSDCCKQAEMLEAAGCSKAEIQKQLFRQYELPPSTFADWSKKWALGIRRINAGRHKLLTPEVLETFVGVIKRLNELRIGLTNQDMADYV